MIKKVSVNSLKPGMFIHNLNCGWFNHPFISQRFKIKSSEEIKKIAAHGIRELYIDTDKGLDVRDAVTEKDVKKVIRIEPEKVLEAPCEPVKDVPAKEMPIKEEIKRAKEIKDEAKKLVVNILGDVRLGKQVKSEKVGVVVSEMADSIFRNQDALISLCRIRQMDEYLYFHSVGVCVLMISLCRIMGVDRGTINDVGMGALLHDVGKTKTPPEILNKPGKLTAGEFDTMKLHVIHGYEILSQSPGIPKSALQVAYEHHERYDGSGYPRGLHGEAISKFGQMAAIVDVYDAITSDRCYHKGMPATEALRKISEWSNFYFNRNLVQNFLKCVGVYPVGTLVNIDDCNLAVVIELGSKSMNTPKVKVIYNSRKDVPVRPYVIDLAESLDDHKILGVEKPEFWGINPFDYVDATP